MEMQNKYDEDIYIMIIGSQTEADVDEAANITTTKNTMLWI